MSESKKTVTELQAATWFLLHTLNWAKDSWPKINEAFRKLFKEEFTVQNEDMAPFDLALASIALEFHALKNILPNAADRVKHWILQIIISDDNFGQYAKTEIDEYEKAVKQSEGRIAEGVNPYEAIPVRLLHRWLGEKIKDFEVKMNGTGTGFISPLLVLQAMEVLFPSLGFWKEMNEKYILIEEEDLTSEVICPPLKKFRTEPEKPKPDGTIEYYDEQGVLQEKWVAPEMLERIFQETGRKAQKVLIKGPWKGIREDYWIVTSEEKEKFVDENGVAYAISFYEKGKARSALIEKELWEHLDELFRKVKGSFFLSKEDQEDLWKEIETEILRFNQEKTAGK